VRTFGLTGGIGTGKSTVASLLRERHGVPIVDADRVARDVVAPGTDGLAAIVRAFGPEVLDASGALDRARMRARIVADPDARRRLEAITHPRIFAATAEALRALADAGHRVAGVEAALMVETGSWRIHDAVVVVSASPETQVRRVMARDHVDEVGARAIVAAQLPVADKERVATVVIRNDADLDALATEVERAWATLRAALDPVSSARGS
jgi:dephospho-CoA kinase